MILPLPAARISTATEAAATPAARLALALAAVHALRPDAIRHLALGDIDIGNRRITAAGQSRPLDDLTTRLITQWLAWRRPRAPPTPTLPTLTAARAPAFLPDGQALGGGCRFRGPRGRVAAATIAVAFHRHAGGAGEHGPVVGEPPPLLAEAAAEFLHPETVPARVLGAYPAHQPTPPVRGDPAEHCLAHSPPAAGRPTRQPLA